jgi:hypothetical protein
MAELWCLRSVRKLRLKGEKGESLPNFLTILDLSMSRACLIRLVQEHAYSTEIALLSVGRTLPKGHNGSGILRVGGRLLGSALPLDYRHPSILAYDTSYSRLLVHSMHLASLHAGPLITASFVNQHGWILGSQQLV